MIGTIRYEHRNTGGRRLLAVMRVDTSCGLDIGTAVYRDVSLAWVRGGFQHPADLRDSTWRALFVGGLLATCGLDNVGPACRDGAESFPQHGRIASQPAHRLRWGTRIIGDQHVHWVSGIVRQPGAPMVLQRTILIADHRPVIRVVDVVTNEGDGPLPIMIQYHCNFGPPYRAPGGRVLVPDGPVLRKLLPSAKYGADLRHLYRDRMV